MLLKNLRILDLSQYIPGPYITRMLADLGAEVIKMEPPAGDPMRFFSSSPSAELSDAYHALNHGKKIVSLNLKDEQEFEKFKEILAGADVLIDGFRPGTLGRLGLNRQTINRINSKLVYCALTGFGQTGPYSHKAGHDLGYCAAAGVLGSHHDHKRPVMTYPPLADHVGGLQACNSILAALYSRTQTGKGAYIDASLYEPLLAWQYLVQSESISQILGGQAAYYNIYETGDGTFITLSALERKFWKQFCNAVNKPHWIDRHDDELPQQQLISELTDFFNTMTQMQLDKLLEQEDCCYEAIPALDAVHEHRQTRFRGIINHYPNLIDNKRLSSNNKLIEITDFKNIGWN